MGERKGETDGGKGGRKKHHSDSRLPPPHPPPSPSPCFFCGARGRGRRAVRAPTIPGEGGGFLCQKKGQSTHTNSKKQTTADKVLIGFDMSPLHFPRLYPGVRTGGWGGSVRGSGFKTFKQKGCETARLWKRRPFFSHRPPFFFSPPFFTPPAPPSPLPTQAWTPPMPPRWRSPPPR